MSWQKRNPEFFAAEMSVVRRRFPDVGIEKIEGRVQLNGLFPVRAEDGSIIRQYRLAIVFPPTYPEWIPDAIMLEPDVKYIADRHIYTNGKACSCLPHEVSWYFPDGIRFRPYADCLLTPWLIGQAYYDEHKRWPSWPTREHGKKGILQGFSDLLGIEDLDAVERYARLLVRKNPAKGHELCPCGSGRKLRDCHFEMYRQCRESLPKKAMRMYREQFFYRGFLIAGNDNSEKQCKARFRSVRRWRR